MKTTYIVLIGVVGVGAVGAYMYMKNKKAQDNLLSGSLPATTSSATTPSKESTTIIKEVNLDEVNFNNALNAIKNFVPQKPPHPLLRKKFDEINARTLQAYIKRFASLGYKYENGVVTKI